jgi:hypothetical protein
MSLECVCVRSYLCINIHSVQDRRQSTLNMKATTFYTAQRERKETQRERDRAVEGSTSMPGSTSTFIHSECTEKYNELLWKDVPLLYSLYLFFDRLLQLLCHNLSSMTTWIRSMLFVTVTAILWEHARATRWSTVLHIVWITYSNVYSIVLV